MARIRPWHPAFDLWFVRARRIYLARPSWNLVCVALGAVLVALSLSAGASPDEVPIKKGKWYVSSDGTIVTHYSTTHSDKGFYDDLALQKAIEKPSKGTQLVSVYGNHGPSLNDTGLTHFKPRGITVASICHGGQGGEAIVGECAASQLARRTGKVTIGFEQRVLNQLGAQDESVRFFALVNEAEEVIPISQWKAYAFKPEFDKYGKVSGVRRIPLSGKNLANGLFKDVPLGTSIEGKETLLPPGADRIRGKAAAAASRGAAKLPRAKAFRIKPVGAEAALQLALMADDGAAEVGALRNPYLEPFHAANKVVGGGLDRLNDCLDPTPTARFLWAIANGNRRMREQACLEFLENGIIKGLKTRTYVKEVIVGRADNHWEEGAVLDLERAREERAAPKVAQPMVPTRSTPGPKVLFSDGRVRDMGPAPLWDHKGVEKWRRDNGMPPLPGGF